MFCDFGKDMHENVFSRNYTSLTCRFLEVKRPPCLLFGWSTLKHLEREGRTLRLCETSRKVIG